MRHEGTHVLRHTGMCRSNGLLFHKKSLGVSPIFYKNITKHWPVFPKFPRKHWKIVQNGPVLREKSLKRDKQLMHVRWAYSYKKNSEIQ